MGQVQQINLTKITKHINTKVAPLVKDLKKYNDELDTVMATKMYPNFQSVRALSFYNTICGHINNNQEWIKKLDDWNNSVLSIKDTYKMMY